MIGSGKRHPERGTPFAVPKTLPKSADARTQPTVLAADESSAGNNLQEDCADAPDTAPKKELVSVQDAEQSGAVKPPTKKRSASCRGEDGEDDEDGEECAAATKLRRGEDGEEGQTRIVTTTCYDPRFDPNSLQAFLCFPISGYCQTWLMLRQVCSIWKSFMHVNAGLDLLVRQRRLLQWESLFVFAKCTNLALALVLTINVVQRTLLIDENVFAQWRDLLEDCFCTNIRIQF